MSFWQYMGGAEAASGPTPNRFLFDADTIDPINDGGSITAWNDSLGNYNATVGNVGTGNPIYQLNGAINSQPTVGGSGVTGNGWMRFSGAALNGIDYTIVCVCRVISAGTEQHWLGLAGTFSAFQEGYNGWRDTTFNVHRVTNFSVNLDATCPSVVGVNQIVVVRLGGGARRVDINGTVTNQDTSTTQFSNLTQCQIGCYTAFGSGSFGGELSILAGWDNALSNADVNAYCSPLATKYGASWTDI